MILGVFALVAVVTLPAPAPPVRASHPRHAAARRAAGTFRLPHLAAGDLYSARARRRLAGYLRLRLLELRELGLERAAEVVERRLPVDTLLPRR